MCTKGWALRVSSTVVTSSHPAFFHTSIIFFLNVKHSCFTPWRDMSTHQRGAPRFQGSFIYYFNFIVINKTRKRVVKTRERGDVKNLHKNVHYLHNKRTVPVKNMLWSILLISDSIPVELRLYRKFSSENEHVFLQFE